MMKKILIICILSTLLLVACQQNLGDSEKKKEILEKSIQESIEEQAIEEPTSEQVIEEEIEGEEKFSGECEERAEEIQCIVSQLGDHKERTCTNGKWSDWSRYRLTDHDKSTKQKIISIDGEEFWEQCINSKELKEYHCNLEKVDFEIIDCTERLTSQSECVNGRCQGPKCTGNEVQEICVNNIFVDSVKRSFHCVEGRLDMTNEIVERTRSCADNDCNQCAGDECSEDVNFCSSRGNGYTLPCQKGILQEQKYNPDVEC